MDTPTFGNGRSIPRTPIAPDPSANLEPDEEEPYVGFEHIPVRDLTDPFRTQKELFSFSGQQRYRDGKLFMERFSGAIATHRNPDFAKSLTAKEVPETWLRTIYQALVQLTTGEAVDTVLNYHGDGVAAYNALRRLIFRLTATNAVPDLKRRLGNWKFPVDRHPSSSIATFRSIQRELAAILPSYDEEHQLADFKLAVPERYAIVLMNKTDIDSDTLGVDIVNFFESFIRHERYSDRDEGDKNKNRRNRGRNPSAGGIQTTDSRNGNGGGQGGRGGGRNGRNGNHEKNYKNNKNDRKPTMPCMICDSMEHFTARCPCREEARRHFAGKKTSGEIAAGINTRTDQVQDSRDEAKGTALGQTSNGPGAGSVTTTYVPYGSIACGVKAVAVQPSHDSQHDSDSAPARLVDDKIRQDSSSSSTSSTHVKTVSHHETVPAEAYNTVAASLTTASSLQPAGLKEFKIDSCAEIHVCNDRSWFSSFTPVQLPTSGVSANVTYAAGVGTVLFSPTATSGQTVPIELRNVYYIPQQSHNLISFARLEDAGFDVRFPARKVHHGPHTFEFTRQGGVYPWRETAAIAAVKPSVPRDRADWQIFFSIFVLIASVYTPGGEPRSHWRELFRKPGNEVCVEGFDVNNSAFNHSWSGRDNYGNPVYEETFINRTLDKALTDFAADPQNTRFIFILPEWKSASWWPLTRHFQTIHRWNTGTELFSCAPTGTINTNKLRPAGDDASPGRYIAAGTPWPVVALFKDFSTHSAADDNVLLHLRLGHPGERATRVIAMNYNTGLDPGKDAHVGCKHCSICHAAKQQRTPAYSSTTPLDSYGIFELIFSDIHGPLPPAFDGSRYLIHFTEARCRYAVTHTMEDRSQAGAALEQYLLMVRSLGYTTKAIVMRTDNDTVYVNTDFKAVCDSHNIKQEFTAPYKHTNAAVAERFWRTLLGIIRALLFTSPFTAIHWPFAARHATYLYNVRPHNTLEMTTPYENLHHKKPDLQHLRVFGCEASALVDEQHRDSKLSSRSVHGLYIGHDEKSAGYLVYVPDTKKVIISADVKFSERFKGDDYGRVVVSHKDINVFSLEAANEMTSLPGNFLDAAAVPKFKKVVDHTVAYIDGETHALLRVVTAARPGGVWVYARAALNGDADPDGFEKVAKHLSNVRKKTAVNEFHPLFAYCQVASRGKGAGKVSPGMVISHDAKSKFAYMVAYADGGTQDVFKGQVTFEVTAAAITNQEILNYIEPRSYNHARSYPDFAEWDAATQDEVNSLIELKVLDPCDEKDIPGDKNVVDSKIVYKLKKNKDGTIDKYKARIVARGFTQVQGEDYDETFAPVTQLVTVRMVIALCLHFNIYPRHLDVRTAFLNAKLTHVVYLKLPTGITIGGKRYGRLLKSLYGLKQASHDWHQLQEQFILNHDNRFKRSSVDPCLYVIIDGPFIAIVSTHVDDYVVGTTDENWYASFVDAFAKRFNVKELGILDHLLQMSVSWSENGSKVTLSQKRFITELAAKHGLTDCKPVQTPMEAGLKLEPAESVDFSLPFRSLVGALLWLARGTRPDIYFAVIYLSRYSNCYDTQHFIAAKRILRYAISTVDRCLTYKKQHNSNPHQPLTITTFSDSDWASDLDRKSFSGCAVRLNGCLVSWGCKKQVTIALSSVEAEYMALSDATRETLYVINLLQEFFNIETPVPIRIDNKGAGFIAENNVNNKRTKHIDVRHHFVRHYIANKLIELFYVPTTENIADIFTKALTTEIFNKLVNMLLN